MPGHLFIVRGDLTRLHCDAALIPSGLGREGGGRVKRDWNLEGRAGIRPARPLKEGWYSDESPAERPERVVALPPSPSGARTTGPQARATWIAHTGEDGHEDDPEWFVLPVLAFLELAAAEGAPVTSREFPLLAFPLVGSGSGGSAHDKGRLMQALVHGVCDKLADSGVRADAVLVADDSEAFAAAQQVRRRCSDQWGALTTGDGTNSTALEQTAAQLAHRARSDRLVLFMGAGVSAGAGLPEWGGLLGALEDRLGEPRIDGSSLDPLDRAELIARRLADRDQELRESLAAILEQTDSVSLQHQLLASLPVTEAATTNYDTLFELAWLDALYRASDRPDWDSEGRRSEIAVLPEDDARSAKRWLLKLHGSLGSDRHPIVLTRGDYLRFERDSSALAGLVQAMLVTREILFVGYSLSDPNFQRIVYDVREALGGGPAGEAAAGRFGRVLTPAEPGARRELWKGEVEFVSTADPDQTGPEPTPEAIRLIEILLDRTVSEAVLPIAYLHDSTYSALLTDTERSVMASLEEARKLAEANEGPLSEALETALADFRPGSKRDWRWRDYRSFAPDTLTSSPERQ